ncbi:MAG: tetratricopeptide repeat protein [Pirellulales bacterium]|nr:tetratricopeptide repeat protein [Pirellulales bacterium]
MLVVLLLGGGALFLDWWHCVGPDAVAHYVGREGCLDCHAEEDELWVGSDHDRAMAIATEKTVLANFDNQEFEHYGVRSRMFRRGDKFLVETDDRDGKIREFEVKYTFGVRPLQQYLVEFPDGRVQCLPLAWDTEKRQWFHLYPDEPIPHGDVLHWTSPAQNWNYMCADCHSTNLQKKYRLATNTYHTTFDEINVSCEACHGPSSLHCELAESWSPFWDRRVGFGLPNLKAEDSRVEIETCAPCHSRRRVVYPGFKPGDHFLDYYVPELLDNNLYYADGQILEEDYVYGSFIQSRMYQNNVRCTNCHDPHSCTVKFKNEDKSRDKKSEVNRIKDNKLCGQCHLPATYDTPQHHFHPDSSKPGTLCIECHMAEATYMVADPRRDHSLRIPRPDLTVSLGIPNACNAKGCHDDLSKGETAQWSLDYVNKWYGAKHKKKEPLHFAHAIDAGRKGTPEGERLLVDAARRKDLSGAVRASIISLLGQYMTGDVCDAWAMIREGLKDPEGLVRVASVRAMQFAPPELLRQRLPPLLYDELRAVRVEAARVLSQLPRGELNTKDREALDKALAEYVKGQNYLSDQSAAHLNLGVIHFNQGHFDEAEKAYRMSLRLDPDFIPVRVNLALLLDQLGKKEETEAQLRKVIEIDPTWAEAHYYLGLLLGEDEARLEEAVASLSKAAELSPNNPKVHYNLAVALQRLRRPDQAEHEYLAAHRLAPGNTNILNAIAVFYYQQKQWEKATAAAERLGRLLPDDRGVKVLLSEIRRAAELAHEEEKPKQPRPAQP